MGRYLLKRFSESFVVLIIVVIVVFCLLRLMPEEGYFGSAAELLTEVQKEQILTNMGLRDPLYVQLGRFFYELAHGDLGSSIIYRPNVPITSILADKIPYSLAFGAGAFCLNYLIGIPMGALMALYKGKWFDNLGTAYIVVINALPAAVYFLFIQLYVTEIFGLPMLFNETNPKSWILPLICMSLSGIAGRALWIRRYIVDQLSTDYIKLAKAKGLSSKAVMFRHVLRNAFVPMSQNIPVNLLMLISGSLYIESLYSIPGMGGLLVTAIQKQDNTLVQALVLIFSSIGVFGMIIGDLLMSVVDPRIKLVRGKTR